MYLPSLSSIVLIISKGIELCTSIRTPLEYELKEAKNVPGYVCIPGSLSVGHYELCCDDIGDLPVSPEHL